MPQSRSLAQLLVVVAFMPLLALAEHSPDRVQIGRDIYVEANQRAGDLVCINCSIFLRGEATGDAVAVGGNVVVEHDARIAGSVTTVLGDVRLQGGSQIAGDVVAVAGAVRRDPAATIAGETTSLAGTGWALLIFLVPLVILGGLIAVIVWLIQRSRRPTAAVPA